jgi:hypothetical protein
MTPRSRLKEDLTNRKFERLTVKEYLGGRECLWRCECACGKTVNIRGGSLRSKNTTSCGCARPGKVSASRTKHGHTKGACASSEYRSWRQMIARCERKTCPDYHNYGGRGIKVCRRWREDFAAFFADMGPRPSKAHTIDRRENSGDYEPGNCHWTTRKEQNRNTRRNRLLTLDSETKTLIEWAEAIGLSQTGLAHRLARGWDLRRALTAPKDLSTRFRPAT